MIERACGSSGGWGGRICRAAVPPRVDEMCVKFVAGETWQYAASLTAETRQQILGVDWLGENFEFVSLGAGSVQKIGGGSLA